MSHIRARSDGRRGLHGNLNLSHAQGTRQQSGGAGQRHYAMVVLGLNRLDEQQSSGRPLSKRPLSSPRACVRTHGWWCRACLRLYRVWAAGAAQPSTTCSLLADPPGAQKVLEVT